jgi:tRNA nucleotidyltransferase (CCA-adding enzyme)
MLPEYVRPAITVSEIMSHNPQILSPGTSVQDAAERMQRFGYEGYPVVRDGRVIGLLTRRAVDRALAHKLNLSAASLMDAGEVVVHPDDSIDHLQHLMTDTGWGQIPVINESSGEIIGIVTRTDLLKILTSETTQQRRPNYAEKLEAAMPKARLELLKAVAAIAFTQKIAFYIVGGFVRDLILERSSQDFDLVVEGDAIALARQLQERYGGRLTTHARFGTSKWLIANIRSELAKDLREPGHADDLPEFLDLISARTEFYTHPTALPTVERGSIKLDLHRRDFTINTLAVRLDGNHYGELHDYWNGLYDLLEGLVRVLHSLSFVDDPTRMLRAVRFEQRFDFHSEKRTQELLYEARSLIKISGDRIRHELDHIMDEDNRVQM